MVSGAGAKGNLALLAAKNIMLLNFLEKQKCIFRCFLGITYVFDPHPLGKFLPFHGKKSADARVHMF
jgi:hypothetical protein